MSCIRWTIFSDDALFFSILNSNNSEGPPSPFFSPSFAEHSRGYITQAIALASDIPSLAELRGGLRDRLLNSVLCDGQGFARDLEAAYRQMWEAWCHKGARALERSTPL
jgi:hypothetical protein